MSPPRPEDDMDMEFDPEDGEDGDESKSSQSGPKMMWSGLVIMGVFTLWDYFASSPPSNPTYAILGVWLMLSTFVSISEVVYA